ncbi:hypothetical protein [Dehalogenimonas etheniformans]|uniref:hypothetical protein n=1 Tax=Dehalogenimonas etheniformans TaxID=1536648 RepID=UPI00139237A6|nr:hypothetical protein [Dehalogenimonas etheniformans]QNT75430.1 hypothetical protein HX448_01365 [Dehalogenimonas etheniformans]
MADASLTKSIVVTAPVIAAAVISLVFGVNEAINPEPTQTFTPVTTTTRPPTTSATVTTAPTTSVPPTTTR